MNTMVIYTNRFIKKGLSGRTFGPIILIKPESRDDVGLLIHEKEHVLQFWRYFPFFGLLYRFSKKRRLSFEVAAYAKQSMSYPDDRVDIFARYLNENYGLDISVEDAKKLILQYQGKTL